VCVCGDLDVFTSGAIGQDGHVATNHAEAVVFNLSPNQIIRLHVQSHRIFDEDGDLLGYVELPDGTWLNEQLLSGGLVQVERRYDHCRARRFELLEQQVRYGWYGGLAGAAIGHGAVRGDHGVATIRTVHALELWPHR